MDCGTIVFVHFIELVDAAHAHISQNQRTCLEGQLLSIRVFHYCGCETHTRTTLSCCVHSSWSHIGNMFEKLRFSNTWITEQCNINLPSDSQIVGGNFGDPACHQKKQRFLHILHTINFWGNRPAQFLINLILSVVSPHVLYFSQSFFIDVHLYVFLFLSCYLGCDQL